MFVDETVNVDVLIIGAGNAGLRAAIEAAGLGAVTIVVSKGPFPSGASTVAGGLLQASFHPEDSKDIHFRDTVQGGGYLSNQKLVRILVNDAPERVLDLEKFGHVFDEGTEARYALAKLGGYSVPRGVMGGMSGNLQKVLFMEAVRRGAKFLNEVMITRLLCEDGRVVGGVGLDIPTGRFKIFWAKSVILASGAVGRLWKVTADTKSATGDGFALARTIGTKMINMEMIQYIPLTFIYPEFVKGNTLGEASTVGKGTVYKNQLGERFMERYDPKRLEATTRDIAARANYLEIKEGRGSVHGGIWVDPTHVNPADSLYTKDRLPERWRMLRDFYGEAAANLQAPFEASPAALYIMGGIEINEKCETSTENLFAVGEVSANIHGANRLGGNALIEIQVFGKIAGENAACKAQKTVSRQCHQSQIQAEYNRIFGLLENKQGNRPLALRKTLQELMWDKVGIVKNGANLEEGLGQILELKKAVQSLRLHSNTRVYNQEWVESLELVNMVEVAEMITHCALLRQESRGVHFRIDFPDRDDENWLRETVVQEAEGELRLSTQPVNLAELKPKELS
jgi:fumarate reductase (CoM/CoB) subunit A